ncbi:MAG: MBOAT family protein [Lachnospiraceae bacterium]|nr:MBOAT family protein [Lachnospiraceae bacterium]
MVFSSLLFVFAFLAIQMIVYSLMPGTKAKNISLLVFSLIFYAWGGPRYLLLLLSEAFVSFYTARQIQRSEFRTMKKRWLVLECVVLLLLLFIFKYTTFFLTNLNLLTGFPAAVPQIVLPIGISFYTFQLISYVADVYRGEVEAQEKYWKVLLYCSLFHQCIAGPIVRYQTVAEEIDHRSVDAEDLAYGVRRFAVGLAKKAILANGCAALFDTLVPELTLTAVSGVSTAGMWLALLAYTLQIYLDFSAYSDMAIGMGRMVGFHYLENFDYPYIAATVQQFWRRWHISLSTFFRDYVYIPLGGNRKGLPRTLLNMAVVWVLTGIWHGASWNYLLWGVYYLVFLVLERLFLAKILEKNTATKVVGHIYTLFVVMLGWALFKFTDFSVLGEVFRALFGVGHNLYAITVSSVFMNYVFFLALAVIAVFPLGRWIRDTLTSFAQREHYRGLLTVIRILDLVTPAALLVLSLLALIGDSYNPFLYFQF